MREVASLFVEQWPWRLVECDVQFLDATPRELCPKPEGTAAEAWHEALEESPKLMQGVLLDLQCRMVAARELSLPQLLGAVWRRHSWFLSVSCLELPRVSARLLGVVSVGGGVRPSFDVECRPRPSSLPFDIAEPLALAPQS